MVNRCAVSVNGACGYLDVRRCEAVAPELTSHSTTFAPLKSRSKPAPPSPTKSGPFQPRSQPFSLGTNPLAPIGMPDPPRDKPAGGCRTYLVRASAVMIVVLLALSGFWAMKGRKANSDAEELTETPVVTEMLSGESAVSQAAPTSPGRTMAEIVASVSPAVVLVEGAEQGTGVIIDRAGYVITNAHVIGDTDEVRVSLNQGETFGAIVASVVGTAPCSDLTLLRLPEGRYPALPLPERTGLQRLSPVFALGYPLHQQRQTVTPFKSDGEIIVTEISMFGIPQMIEHTASLNHGNSGGPLFDKDGTLLGINTIGLSQTGGIYYAIDAAYARTVVEHLRNGVPLETVPLSSHESIEFSVNSREEKACFSFAAKPGQTVTVSVISITKHNDPTLRLYDPSNLQIPLLPTKNWDEHLTLPVEKSGTYLIVVGSGYNIMDDYRITLTVE